MNFYFLFPYDTIGWMISEGKSFQGILNYYRDEVFNDFIGAVDEDGTKITLEYIIPKKTLLLKTWIEKGYQPKQIK